MYKNLKVSALTFEMLVVIAKKGYKKPDDFVEQLIQEHYNKIKK
jgi:hypothetical protein